MAHKWLHTHYNQERTPRGICACGHKDFRDNATVPNDPRYQELAKAIDAIKDDQYNYSYLIPIMQKAQQAFGYLSTEVMDFIAVKMQIPTSRIYGVATFYHLFKLKPKGKYNFAVCLGTACYVKGAQDIVNEIEKQFDIKVGDTTADGLFSLEIMRCFGACGLAPVMLVNDKVYGKVTAKEAAKIAKLYKEESKNG
jgi:NADH:ubiquinone oxidoreductase subunit E